MILVTGAGGKTGLSLVHSLASRHEPVRAMVRHSGQETMLRDLGAKEIYDGDFLDIPFIKKVCQGIRAIYHICPNMNPDELKIADILLNAAKESGIDHFVYHSVLHPQIEAMPHHWLKMRVEERIFTSGLNFTIVQPAPYMQNIHGYWEKIIQQGQYALPYDASTCINMVDLEDVTEASANILTNSGHHGAIYELAGPEALTQTRVGEIISKIIKQPVKVTAVNRQNWDRQARLSNMPDYSRETLLKMFEYYEQFGFNGSAYVLECLLGRPAHRFSEFIEHLSKGDKLNG